MKKVFENKELNFELTDIGKKSVKNGFFSILSQLSSFLILMISTIVLARLLTPNDYGLVAITIAMVTFFTIFKDLGLSITIIQKEDITNDEITEIFYFGIILGLLLTIVMSLSAPIISNVFNDERLNAIIIVSSFSFIINSFSIVPIALLKRKMQFKKLMNIQILSSFCSAITTIYLAYAGFGYWSLVVNLILPFLITSILSIISLNWFPLLNLKFNSIKSFINLGKYLMYFDLINYFSKNADNFLIAKYYSTDFLGYYSKAYQLLLLPIQQIRIPIVNVALPVLSRVKNDNKKFNHFYLLLSKTLNFIIVPVVCYMWLNTHEIVLIILGDQWVFTGDIFKVLVFAALIQPILGTFGLILITLGKNKKYFHWGIIHCSIILTSFGIGIQYDLITFTIIYVIANYISFIFSIFYILRNTGINVKQFIIDYLLLLSYFISVSLLINLLFPNIPNILSIDLLLFKTVFFIISIVIFLAIFKSYRELILNIKTKFKE